MNHASALTFFLNVENLSVEEIDRQLIKAKNLVSEGRYLIVVFESPHNWESKIPIESEVLKLTLGAATNRDLSWEFYGNGAIRTFAGKSLTIARTFQWTIVRRIGDKPYKRIKSLPNKHILRNQIPVKDKVFTRDVANNIWHLNDVNFKKRIISRFASLLTWDDEDFYVVSGNTKRLISLRKKLDLSDDLVGVPTREPYLWKSDDVLF